ncbi:uncharacterized protein MONBRDRAFT_32439, partial [Monosiga brevicollis MX1]
MAVQRKPFFVLEMSGRNTSSGPILGAREKDHVRNHLDLINPRGLPGAHSQLTADGHFGWSFFRSKLIAFDAYNDERLSSFDFEGAGQAPLVRAAVPLGDLASAPLLVMLDAGAMTLLVPVNIHTGLCAPALCVPHKITSTRLLWAPTGPRRTHAHSPLLSPSLQNFATALALGTTDGEIILLNVPQANYTHPWTMGDEPRNLVHLNNSQGPLQVDFSATPVALTLQGHHHSSVVALHFAPVQGLLTASFREHGFALFSLFKSIPDCIHHEVAIGAHAAFLSHVALLAATSDSNIILYLFATTQPRSQEQPPSLMIMQVQMTAPKNVRVDEPAALTTVEGVALRFDNTLGGPSPGHNYNRGHVLALECIGSTTHVLHVYVHNRTTLARIVFVEDHARDISLVNVVWNSVSPTGSTTTLALLFDVDRWTSFNYPPAFPTASELKLQYFFATYELAEETQEGATTGAVSATFDLQVAQPYVSGLLAGATSNHLLSHDWRANMTLDIHLGYASHTPTAVVACLAAQVDALEELSLGGANVFLEPEAAFHACHFADLIHVETTLGTGAMQRLLLDVALFNGMAGLISDLIRTLASRQGQIANLSGLSLRSVLDWLKAAHQRAREFKLVLHRFIAEGRAFGLREAGPALSQFETLRAVANVFLSDAVVQASSSQSILIVERQLRQLNAEALQCQLSLWIMAHHLLGTEEQSWITTSVSRPMLASLCQIHGVSDEDVPHDAASLFKAPIVMSRAAFEHIALYALLLSQPKLAKSFATLSTLPALTKLPALTVEQHETILRVGMSVGAKEWTCRYWQAHRVDILQHCAAGLTVQVLVDNKLSNFCFTVLRNNYHDDERAWLHFFQACLEAKQISSVLQLPLNQLESEGLVKTLARSQEARHRAALFVYLLQRGRFAEAREVDAEVRFEEASRAGQGKESMDRRGCYGSTRPSSLGLSSQLRRVHPEGAAERQAMINNYLSTLPPSQRHLALHTRTSLLSKTPSTPLNRLNQKSPGASPALTTNAILRNQGVATPTRTSLLETVVAKIEGTPSASPTVTKPARPFEGPPVTPSRQGAATPRRYSLLGGRREGLSTIINASVAELRGQADQTGLEVSVLRPFDDETEAVPSPLPAVVSSPVRLLAHTPTRSNLRKQSGGPSQHLGEHITFSPQQETRLFDLPESASPVPTTSSPSLPANMGNESMDMSGDGDDDEDDSDIIINLPTDQVIASTPMRLRQEPLSPSMSPGPDPAPSPKPEVKHDLPSSPQPRTSPLNGDASPVVSSTNAQPQSAYQVPMDESDVGAVPEAETSDIEGTKSEVVEPEDLGTGEPETQSSEAEVLETEAPETEAPETEAPETEALETEALETGPPETEAQGTEAMETEAMVSESDVPPPAALSEHGTTSGVVMDETEDQAVEAPATPAQGNASPPKAETPAVALENLPRAQRLAMQAKQAGLQDLLLGVRGQNTALKTPPRQMASSTTAAREEEAGPKSADRVLTSTTTILRHKRMVRSPGGPNRPATSSPLVAGSPSASVSQAGQQAVTMPSPRKVRIQPAPEAAQSPLRPKIVVTNSPKAAQDAAGEATSSHTRSSLRHSTPAKSLAAQATTTPVHRGTRGSTTSQPTTPSSRLRPRRKAAIKAEEAIHEMTPGRKTTTSASATSANTPYVFALRVNRLGRPLPHHGKPAGRTCEVVLATMATTAFVDERGKLRQLKLAIRLLSSRIESALPTDLGDLNTLLQRRALALLYALSGSGSVTEKTTNDAFQHMSLSVEAPTASVIPAKQAVHALTKPQHDAKTHAAFMPMCRKDAGRVQLLQELARHDNYRYEINQGHLLKDVLLACHGNAGKYIIYDSRIEAFRVAPDVGVPAPTRQLVSKLAELGWLFNQVRLYIETCRGDLSYGAVGQAFCSALHDQLADYYRLIAVLEGQLELNADGRLNDEQLQLTLRRLVVWTAEPFFRLKHLLVNHVMVASLQPLYDMLHDWVFFGNLNDQHGEFFVTANRAAVEAQHVWTHRFGLRSSMLPSFFPRALAETVLSVGKTIEFIRSVCG